MFTVEIKVNGALIGHIHGRNLGKSCPESAEDRYGIEYYKPETRGVQEMSIDHKHADGIEKLVLAILAKVVD